jgi:hypothetical protein
MAFVMEMIAVEASIDIVRDRTRALVARRRLRALCIPRSAENGTGAFSRPAG